MSRPPIGLLKRKNKMSKRIKQKPETPKSTKLTKRIISDSKKREIIEDYLNSDMTKTEALVKHLKDKKNEGQFLRWMRKFGYTDKPKRYKEHRFTVEQKHMIIHDYLLSGASRQSIWYKYTGHDNEGNRISDWMKSLGYIKDDIEKNINLASTNISEMSKYKSIKPLDSDTKALKSKIARLEKELEEAKIKAIAFSTMIDIAERQLNVPIRKKLNTKPLKK